jgi:hypothetical protein
VAVASGRSGPSSYLPTRAGTAGALLSGNTRATFWHTTSKIKTQQSTIVNPSAPGLMSDHCGFLIF